MKFTPEQQSKIDGFQWVDDGIDSGIVQPELEVCNKILECVESVGEYVVQNLDILDLQQDIYSVDVPIETHPLLSERFNDKWSEYSRSRVFDMIRAVFIQKLDDLGYVNKIIQKVLEVFPNSNANIRISRIDFYDEPEIDMEITERSLNLLSGEENVIGTKTYNYSGNTITVEFKIEIVELQDKSQDIFGITDSTIC